MNLWQRSTLDGKYKAKNGSIKTSEVKQHAEQIYGSLPDPDQAMSTLEIATLLPVKTIAEVSLKAHMKASATSNQMAEQWSKVHNRVTNREKNKDKQSLKQYAIRLDTLKPPPRKKKNAPVPTTLPAADKSPSAAARQRALAAYDDSELF